MSFGLPDSIATTLPIIPPINPADMQKLSDVPLHCVALTGVTVLSSAYLAAYSVSGFPSTGADRDGLFAAIAVEQVNAARGYPVWTEGKRLASMAEPGITRQWSASGAHARKVTIGTLFNYTFVVGTGLAANAAAADANKVFVVDDAPPSSGTINDGDLCYSTGRLIVYRRLSGAWKFLANVASFAAAEASALAIPGLVFGTDETYAGANIAILQARINAGDIDMPHLVATVTINDTFVVPAGRKFNAPNLTLRAAAGTNKGVLVNAGLLQTPKGVTITAVDAYAATVDFGATPHGIADQRGSLTLQGANEKDWWATLRVRSVTSATVLVVTTNFRTTAVPTGTIVAYINDVASTIRCKLDYNFANNASAAAGSPTTRNAGSFAFMGDSVVDIAARNVNKYGVVTGAMIGCTISGDCYDVAESVKTYGPSRDNLISVRGRAVRDDVGTVQAKEGVGFEGYMACKGNIYNLTFRNGSRQQSGGSASGEIVVYTDDDFMTSDLVFENEDVDATLGAAFMIRRGAGLPVNDTVPHCGRVTLRGGTYKCATGTVSIQVLDYVSELVLDRIKIVGGTGAGSLMRIQAASPVGYVDRLRLVGLELDMSPNTAIATIFSLDGGYRILTAEHCQFIGSASGNKARLFGLVNAAKKTSFRACRFDYVDTIVTVGSAIPPGHQLTYDDCEITNIGTAASINAAGSVMLRNVVADTISAGLVRPNAAAAVVDVYSEGRVSVTNGSVVVCVNGGTVNPKSPTLPIDINASNGILPTAGNQAFHINATRLGIGPNTPVIADGTTWRRAASVAQSIASSATPAVNLALGNICTLTATSATAWANPTNIPPAGERGAIVITQDATGGWSQTFGSAYIFATAYVPTGNSAGKKTVLNWVSDGSALVMQGANSWY